jgi:hypothetical protein
VYEVEKLGNDAIGLDEESVELDGIRVESADDEESVELDGIRVESADDEESVELDGIRVESADCDIEFDALDVQVGGVARPTDKQQYGGHGIGALTLNGQ